MTALAEIWLPKLRQSLTNSLKSGRKTAEMPCPFDLQVGKEQSPRSFSDRDFMDAHVFGSWTDDQEPTNKGRTIGATQKLSKSVEKHLLGVLSHHRKCEMKSPHLVDFS